MHSKPSALPGPLPPEARPERRGWIDLFLHRDAASLQPGDLLRLRLGAGACLLFTLISLLMLPLLSTWPGPSVYKVVLFGWLGVMAVTLAAMRWTRSASMPGTVVCLALLGNVTLVVHRDPSPYAGFWYAFIPLATSLLTGPQLTVLSMVVGVSHMVLKVLQAPAETPIPELWARSDAAFEVVLVGGLSLLYEHLRKRAERERDRAEANTIRLAQEQALRVEAEQAQARLVRQQALRVDVSTALAERGPLGPSLQRCCEALVRHLDASLALVWTAEPPGGALELQGCAGQSSELREALGTAPASLEAIAREKRTLFTGDGRVALGLAEEAGAGREDRAALAAYPLQLGEQTLGVVAVLSTAPLHGDTADALGAVADALAQGIERRRAEQALRQRAEELARTNAELERFAYVASHDLQEPLRMVSSYTQLLARRYRGQLDANADEFIGYAVDGVKRMQHLITDLLAYSRVGTRGRPFHVVDSGGVMAEVLQDLSEEIAESGARVTFDPLPEVYGDAAQLHQLLRNLIANGLKFHAAGEAPQVHVSVEARAGEWLFRVRDHGIGIDPAYFPRLFILFQRLHTRGEYPGTGIGLAICKKIVERHGGRIWVESAPGQGTTFLFTLPRAPLRATA